MLEEGTATRRSAEEMAEAIEDIGGALEVGATGASLRVRAEDLADGRSSGWPTWRFGLAFPADGVHAGLRRKMSWPNSSSDRDDPAFPRRSLIFRGVVYGDHPYGRDPRGNARETRQADPRRRHRATIKPDLRP